MHTYIYVLLANNYVHKPPHLLSYICVCVFVCIYIHICMYVAQIIQNNRFSTQVDASDQGLWNVY